VFLLVLYKLVIGSHGFLSAAQQDSLRCSTISGRPPALGAAGSSARLALRGDAILDVLIELREHLIEHMLSGFHGMVALGLEWQLRVGNTSLDTAMAAESIFILTNLSSVVGF